MKFKSYTFLIVFMTIMRTSAQFRKFFDNLGFNNLPLPFHTPQNSNNYQATSKPQEISRRFLQESPTDNNCGSCFSYRTGLFGYGASSGLIEIPHPDPVQSEVRAVLTVATQLSVNFFNFLKVLSSEKNARTIYILYNFSFILFFFLKFVLIFEWIATKLVDEKILSKYLKIIFNIF